MGRVGSHLFPVNQIPDLDLSVSGTRCEPVQGSRVLRHGVHSIDVPVPKLPDERLGEHAVQLGRIEGAGVFPGFGEGVQAGIEVAGLRGGGAARGEIGLGGAGERFDPLFTRSA